MQTSHNRLKRKQHRVWKRAANALLMLNQHLTISIAFILILIFGSFWIVFEEHLEEHLFDQARLYGYGVARYSAADLAPLLGTSDVEKIEKYLDRLVKSPMLVSATLYDNQGRLKGEIKPEAERSLTDENQVTLLQDIMQGRERLGILKITLNRTEQEAPIQDAMSSLSFLALFLMLIAIICAVLIARLLLNPVLRLLALPLERPDEARLEQFDVASEIKQMLESTSPSTAAPAPLSETEASGIHSILAMDSVAHEGEVVVLHLYLCDLKQQLTQLSKKQRVSLLRNIDKRLLVTVHGQMGLLVSFDGQTASACFGLGQDTENPEFKALCCALLLHELLSESGVKATLSIRREPRMILRHNRRTPLAINLEPGPSIDESVALTGEVWIHANCVKQLSKVQQLSLISESNHWHQIAAKGESVLALYERQKAWTKYLLGEQ